MNWSKVDKMMADADRLLFDAPLSPADEKAAEKSLRDLARRLKSDDVLAPMLPPPRRLRYRYRDDLERGVMEITFPRSNARSILPVTIRIVTPSGEGAGWGYWTPLSAGGVGGLKSLEAWLPAWGAVLISNDIDTVFKPPFWRIHFGTYTMQTAPPGSFVGMWRAFQIGPEL